MANRFPLIVNPDTKEIQELAQNDNLDLTGSGIYAGGSLGQNGQVLTTNGTSVEWRTVTSSGGGGSGIDSDTTYIVTAEDQIDGASLNLVAGGSGIGTIKIKFQDSDQLQFNTSDSLTITPIIKTGSIENAQLENSGITFRINGVNTLYELGSTVTIPQYGDVFATSNQTISNKTFTDCTMSLAASAGNSIVSIPNSSLINSSININGTNVALGGSITITGGGGVGDNDTTYTLAAFDWSENGADNPNKKTIRLTGSDASTSNVVVAAGDRMSITRTDSEITLECTEVDTDTDTRYDISTDTLVVGNNAVGARLNLTANNINVKTGGSTAGAVDRLNLRNGTGVTVSSISDSDVQFAIGQSVSTDANVTFNDLTLTGSLTIEGATTIIDSTNLVVTDKTITIADGVTSSLQANGAGILLGTSNINIVYNHDSSAWRSTSNFDLSPTKSYKIGGTEVLTASTVLGKSVPLGDIIGTVDTQTLSNKTLINPVVSSFINTGTVYLPAPNIADTLVGRSTSDILTNKTIDGSVNNLSNIGNSSLSNSYMIINGTQRNLGDTFTVTATDAYTDEKAQDTVAGMITNATHSGITWSYDDTAGTLAATVTAGGASSDTLQDVTARGATSNVSITLSNILHVNSQIHIGNSSLRFDHQGGQSTFGNVAGAGGVTVRCGQARQIDFTNENGTVTFASLSDSGGLTAGGLTYPTTNGTSGQVLTSDGAGNVTWSTVSGGGTPSSITDGTSTLGFNTNNDLELACHIIPDTNATYDLGSAEYKIRHLYLSQNTLYYEGEYLKVAQHNTGGVAGQASYMLPLSKIQEVLNASVDFESFKTQMLAIVDAAE